MTKKFDDFVTALRSLCVEHGVHISPEMYDGLQVWDCFPAASDPIGFPFIENCIKEVPNAPLN